MTSVILLSMKTAISIPEPIFKAAETLAKHLGISRSELYSTAVARYVEEHDAEQITQQLNHLYAVEDAVLDPVVRQLQSVSLSQEEW